MAVSRPLPAAFPGSNRSRRDTAVTYFPHTPEGDSRFELFRKVASINPMKHTLNALDWNVGQHGTQFALALFTFL